ncbi:hypothetical protein QA634_05370 [Methylobacterium sp. CB376]|uniref:hypothetical protein n=1 Tax=unclassified Methylobacterium TaxID=2615210 RepID=UPI000321E6FB|nr:MULTISPECIES: hypothetical protein [Methylobacterium]WFT81324.1 hypothetical protein QA634_05370 [Methylobacterium nodulans]
MREAHRVPILMGEAGENSDAWVRACRAVLERHRVGWAFWTYGTMDAASTVRRPGTRSWPSKPSPG